MFFLFLFLFYHLKLQWRGKKNTCARSKHIHSACSFNFLSFFFNECVSLKSHLYYWFWIHFKAFAIWKWETQTNQFNSRSDAWCCSFAAISMNKSNIGKKTQIKKKSTGKLLETVACWFVHIICMVISWLTMYAMHVYSATQKCLFTVCYLIVLSRRNYCVIFDDCFFLQSYFHLFILWTTVIMHVQWFTMPFACISTVIIISLS